MLVAIPAVMVFNYFTGRVEAFDVEMDNSSSELIDYFIKQERRAPVSRRAEPGLQESLVRRWSSSAGPSELQAPASRMHRKARRKAWQ